jgi:hypothetical protein
MMTMMMECGHSANATKSDGNPACAICAPSEASYKVVEAPDLTGRMARCHYAPKGGTRKKCQQEVPSETTLAFFGHRPGEEKDSFYCGCYGWN